MIKQILLNFDLEEFDIPEEYGQKVDNSTKIQISSDGLSRILDLLDKLDLKATFFTTVYFAKNQFSLIQRVIKKHELASHSISHSNFKDSDLLGSRLELEKLSGKKMLAKLELYLVWLKNRAGFVTCSTFTETFRKQSLGGHS